MNLKLVDFVGNEPLFRLLRRRDLPPSCIFSGPSGVGKKTAAILLAGLANCSGNGEGDLCGRCPSCVQLHTVDDTDPAKRSHPDILLADTAWIGYVSKKQGKKSNPQVIPVAAAREIVQEAQFRPLQGRRRFFIVDEAEKMNESAQNALLKTLEEPPETTRIILVTAFLELLLATIQSRCQRYHFKPLDRSELAEYLVERKELDLQHALLAASFSNGSIGTALELDLEAAVQDREALLRLLESWLERRTFQTVFDFCEQDASRAAMKDRERVKQFLEHLEVIAQDLYVIRVGTESRAANQDILPRLKSLSKGLSVEWIDKFLYHIRTAHRDVSRYVSPLICFETLWLEIEKEDAGTR